jgi:hypothetical protein
VQSVAEGCSLWEPVLVELCYHAGGAVVAAAVAALAFISSAYKTGVSGIATATANATSEKSAQSAARRLLLLLLSA